MAGKSAESLPYSVVASLTVGASPESPVFDPANGNLYVPVEGDDNVAVIAGANLSDLGNISVGGLSANATPAVDPITGNVFVPDGASNQVTVVSGASNHVLTTVPAGSALTPGAPAYDPSGGMMVVPGEGSNQVLELSGDGGYLGSATVENRAESPVYYSSGFSTGLLVPNGNVSGSGGNVTILDANNGSVEGTIAVGHEPEGAAYDPLTGDLLVSNWGSGTLSVISTLGTVSQTIPVGIEPEAPVYDARGGVFYVSNFGSNNVSVIDAYAPSLSATVPVGLGPEPAAITGGDGAAYIANSGSDNVTVLAPFNYTVLATIPVGADPMTPVYDENTGQVYVANAGSANVSVVQGAVSTTAPVFPVEFKETGLPAGGNWSLSVGGQTYSTNTTTVSLDLANGTYAYAVTALQGYTPLRQNGSVTVNGVPSTTAVVDPNLDGMQGVLIDPQNDRIYAPNSSTQVLHVLNATSYANVTSLRIGSTGWSPILGENGTYIYIENAGSNNVSVVDTATETVVASLPVGSSPWPGGYDPANGRLYVPNSGSGNVTVIATSNHTIVGTVRMYAEPVGVIPIPTLGEVAIESYNGSNNPSILEILNTTNDTIVANISIATQEPYGGWFDAATGDVDVCDSLGGRILVVSLANRTVVERVWLPGAAYPQFPVYDPGNGMLYLTSYSPGSVLVFDPSDSQFIESFSTPGQPTIAAYDPLTGEVVASLFLGPGLAEWNGTAQTVPVPFVRVVDYPVWFNETGLPAGDAWSVAFDHEVSSNHAASIEFDVANGTDLAFEVGAVTGYESTPDNGTLNVTGAPANRSIAFAATVPPQYPLWFNETGLPSGATWWVTLFDPTVQNRSTTGGSIEFLLLGGSSGTFGVGSSSADSPSLDGGTFSMPTMGPWESQPVQFRAPPPAPSITSFTGSPTSLTLGGTVTYAVVATGGSGSLSYRYEGLPTPCETSNVTTLSCTPGATGTSTTEVVVTDGLDRAATANVTVTVDVVPTSTPPPTGNSTGSSGLPASYVYAAVGAVAAIALAAGVLAWRRRRAGPPGGPADPA